MTSVPKSEDPAQGKTTPEASKKKGADGHKNLRGIITGVSVLVVLLAAYVIAAWALGDRVPRGTTVAGVTIGSMAAPDAKAALNEALASVTEGPIAVSVGTIESSLDPQEAGLAFDADKTVDPLVGFTLSPARMWQHITGSGGVEPVTAVDEEKLARALFVLAEDFKTEAVDATIQFVDGKPETTPSETGLELDSEGAVTFISDNWLTGASPLELPSRTIQPVINDEEVDRVLSEQAKPLVSAPISVAVEDTRKDLNPNLLASAASFATNGTKLELDIDPEVLAEYLREEIPKLEKAPVDATIKLGDDGPEITKDKPGTKIDTESLREDVLTAAADDVRTVTLNFEETAAEHTKADIEELGIKERVSSFSTPHTSDTVRTNNLRIGAKDLNGTIVMPGETFSLIDAIYPLTAEKGYGEGGMIIDGILKRAVGGGMSQLATTVYNAAFFAGLEDVEHKPHSQYFSRYPEGREATLASPHVDLKFRNNSDHGIMIESWVGDGQVNVVFWGTKEWEIKSEISSRRDVVPAKTVTISDADCRPYSPGSPGFAVTVKRLFYKGDELVKTESQSWRYSPSNGVRCAKDD